MEKLSLAPAPRNASKPATDPPSWLVERGCANKSPTNPAGLFIFQEPKKVPAPYAIAVIMPTAGASTAAGAATPTGTAVAGCECEPRISLCTK